MRYITALLLLLPFSLAVPTPQSGDVECGRDDYTGDEISAAANAACNYVQQGTTAGGSKYPEPYNDYEGFSFGGVQGPYYEFPILEDGSIYDGGSPGADRVIINESCEIAGEVTHSGASGNGFVGCSGTSKRKEKL